jgi:sugar lactone lactonase YvrE
MKNTSTKTAISEAPAPIIDSIMPTAALPGGEIELRGSHLGPVEFTRPAAFVGVASAPVLLSRAERMIIKVPEALSGNLTSGLQVRQNGVLSNSVELKVARTLATKLHVVANPAVDPEGHVFATFSGDRGQETPVSVYRIELNGELSSLASGIMNATGVALDPAGYLYVSSRHEGTVYRVSPAGAASVYAEGMGVATGIAFDEKGNLYVGDRSGTIFKINPDRQIFVFATLEPSVAAYHLAFGLDGTLFVTGPTTSSFDNVYAIDRDGNSKVFYRGLGRPQGLAVDSSGNLYVAASLGGKRGIVRITLDAEATLVVAGSSLVGLAFGYDGETVLATSSSVYQIALGIEGLRLF